MALNELEDLAGIAFDAILKVADLFASFLDNATLVEVRSRVRGEDFVGRKAVTVGHITCRILLFRGYVGAEAGDTVKLRLAVVGNLSRANISREREGIDRGT